MLVETVKAVGEAERTVSRSGRYVPEERASSFLRIGGWLDPTAGFEFWKKRWISCPWREANPISHSAHRLVSVSAMLVWFVLYFGVTAPSGQGRPRYRGFYVTLRPTTLGRTPLDEWSARRRDLCLTTHNTHNRQTSMFPPGFEPTISAGERPQTHTLDRAATGTALLRLR